MARCTAFDCVLDAIQWLHLVQPELLATRNKDSVYTGLVTVLMMALADPNLVVCNKVGKALVVLSRVTPLNYTLPFALVAKPVLHSLGDSQLPRRDLLLSVASAIRYSNPQSLRVVVALVLQAATNELGQLKAIMRVIAAVGCSHHHLLKGLLLIKQRTYRRKMSPVMIDGEMPYHRKELVFWHELNACSFRRWGARFLLFNHPKCFPEAMFPLPKSVALFSFSEVGLALLVASVDEQFYADLSRPLVSLPTEHTSKDRIVTYYTFDTLWKAFEEEWTNDRVCREVCSDGVCRSAESTDQPARTDLSPAGEFAEPCSTDLPVLPPAKRTLEERDNVETTKRTLEEIVPDEEDGEITERL